MCEDCCPRYPAWARRRPQPSAGELTRGGNCRYAVVSLLKLLVLGRQEAIISNIPQIVGSSKLRARRVSQISHRLLPCVSSAYVLSQLVPEVLSILASFAFQTIQTPPSAVNNANHLPPYPKTHSTFIYSRSQNNSRTILPWAILTSRSRSSRASFSTLVVVEGEEVGAQDPWPLREPIAAPEQPVTTLAPKIFKLFSSARLGSRKSDRYSRGMSFAVS